VLYTDTAVVLLKFIVFVILLSLLVYQQYYYFAAGVALVSVYLFTRPGGGAGAGEGPWPWPVPGMDNAARRVDKDELTTGIPLVTEGFSIAMPKIIKGDDSGKDYHRSNKFIEEDSRDFTEKYFNSKKCGIGSGIGGITMFGSNELIGGSRTAALSGLYNFDAYYVVNDDRDSSANRYKYFKDCVFEPVKRTFDPTTQKDFRNIKTTICDNVNNKIIHINGILGRFDKTMLFNTQTNPNADYSQRISLSSRDKLDNELVTPQTGTAYKSLIIGDDNKTKLKNIQPLSDSDNINDKMYAELLTMTNNDLKISTNARQRQLEVYAKVYEIRKNLDSIFANMRAQTKDDAASMYTVRIGEPVIQELRTMLSYLATIQRTNDIILFEKNAGPDKLGIYNMAPIGLPPTGTLGVISNTEGAYKSKIVGVNNIFKIPTVDDTYNNNDEKRYVYGLTYYFDKWNSKPTGA
jgi:hypothetical protein